MKIVHKKQGKNLQFHISFLKPIENKKDYAIVTLCSFAGYFVDKEKLNILIKDLKNLMVNDQVIGDIEMFDQDIEVTLYLEELRHCVKKVNEVMIAVGCQAFLNIYFHLYHDNGYKDILEFYDSIKKEV